MVPETLTYTVMLCSGIVYAHRNEDIVNFGPGIQGETELNVHLKDTVHSSCVPAIRKRKPEVLVGGKNVIESATSSKIKKKSQYSLIARFIGMDEVEFSKWLLSATPEECEKVLQNYKRRKDKIPDG